MRDTNEEHLEFKRLLSERIELRIRNEVRRAVFLIEAERRELGRRAVKKRDR